MRIHEVSSSIPSYPDQRTRYSSLHRHHRWSTFESSISDISNSGSPSTSTGGGGVGMQPGIELDEYFSNWDM